MRSMTTLLVVLFLAVPLGASAQEQEEPLVLDIGTNWAGGRTIDGWENTNGVIHFWIVGHFLWLEWGDPEREPDSLSEDYVSTDVSDPTIIQVKAYLDGTVDVIRSQPEPEPTPEPTPEPVEVTEETVDLVVRYPEIRWGALLPGGLRVE